MVCINPPLYTCCCGMKGFEAHHRFGCLLNDALIVFKQTGKWRGEYFTKSRQVMRHSNYHERSMKHAIAVLQLKSEEVSYS